MMGWQWHQLDHMQIICTSLQADNYGSTSSLSFYCCFDLRSTLTFKLKLKLRDHHHHHHQVPLITVDKRNMCTVYERESKIAGR